MTLESHDYAKLNMIISDHKIEIEQNKDSIPRGVDRALIEKGPNNKTQTGIKNNISVSNIVNSAEISICFEKTLLMYGHGSLSTLLIRDHILDQLKTSINGSIQINISELVASSLFRTNYIELKQNTEEWENIRGNKITAIRLAYVLGLHGEKMFTEYWDIVK